MRLSSEMFRGQYKLGWEGTVPSASTACNDWFGLRREVKNACVQHIIFIGINLVNKENDSFRQVENFDRSC